MNRTGAGLREAVRGDAGATRSLPSVGPAGGSDVVAIRRRAERGHFDHGWLDTYHTFSFGDYHDPRHMGFRALRVMNEDRVRAGAGFGMHGHRDTEIITYVLEGSLEHRDSLGNGSVLRAGDLQHMTAGTGVRHSEFNPSASEPLHLYQIWLLPDRQGLAPGYAELRRAERPTSGGLWLVASPDGRNGSLWVYQDADIFLAVLDRDDGITHALRAGRYAWLQVLRGGVEIEGQRLVAGDGAAVSGTTPLVVTGLSPSEVMLFDLS